MTALDQDTGTKHPPRDRWGKPVIPNPHQPNETVTAERPSGLAETIKDHYAIQAWATRIRLIGCGLRPDLPEMAAPLHPTRNRTELDGLAEQAFQAGGGETRANHGTARHTWLEQLTLNPTDTLNRAPQHIRPDLEAIHNCIQRNNIRPHISPDGTVWQEQFVITRLDQWGWAAGTADLHATVRDADTVAIVDLKTSARDPRKHPVAAAVQLACYAHAEWAWPHPDRPLKPAPECQTGIAWILWAPAGTGTCELIPINIHEGWKSAILAAEVKQHRRNQARYRIQDDPPTPPTLAPDPLTAPALIARLNTLTEHGVTKQALAADWPNVPTLKHPEQHTPETLAELDRYVRLHETRVGLYPADQWRHATTEKRAIKAGTTVPALAKLHRIPLDKPPLAWQLDQIETRLRRLEKQATTTNKKGNKAT